MKKFPSLIKDECGGVAALTAILLAAFLGLLAMVVDLGHLHIVQNELQNAADAAALAGARAIYPLTAPPWALVDPPPCGTQVIPAALAAAYDNRADYHHIDVKVEEVIPGFWDYTKTPSLGAFTQSACTAFADTNAVMVTTRMRGDLSQGSVIMTFAKFLGYNTVDVRAYAIAAVGYLDTLPKGSAGGFIAPNDDFMNRIYTDYPPSNEDPLNRTKFYLIIGAAGGQLNWQYADNAGWSCPPDTNPTPQYLKGVIDNGTTIDLSIGDSVSLSNGEQTPVLVDIANHVPLDITVPTVSTDAYNQDQPIQNFYEINLTRAWKPGDKLPDDVATNLRPILDEQGHVMNGVGIIEFELIDKIAVSGSGGSNPSNVYGNYPKLVYNDSDSKLVQ